ncbi:Transcriptional regulator, AbiEi antitoxin, Type IV TA system [Arthrobacter sp. ov407]|uniref:type IV toxin-antitoxin system AbiEi family antitoxin domain-containing protein n=1 Tax=Arthrobacter sp. ov407 TaxID=1761748 RepID=UPI00088B62E0|nr:type IV toxin-antitoxin system AbiEi family antitoxin domain-containing protein [Arthrobacter sp. ov407]SDK45633.1 Transcriptional regulator, AbiEi antitoxin, Type IV TA system [Arthrobacter sp. ov407]
MDLTGYLKYAGSVARTGTLLQAGFSERSIRNAVAAGEIRRLRHGVVALPGARADFVAAVLANGTLCCASAAPFHGIWRLHEPERLHLLCAHGSAPGVVIHRGSLVPAGTPQPVASLTDTLLHALRCLPAVDAAVMVESALLQGRTTLDYLRQRLPGNRNGAARAVLDLVDGTADSAVEVVARLLFQSQGIYIQTQVNLPGIGIVDFLLEGFLIVEIDGSTHLEPAQVKKDRGRNNASTLTGYAVLRYGYHDVVYNPQKVVDEVWQVLRGRVIR